MFEEFKKVSKEEWASKATSDLKGEDVFSKYNWQLGSINILPYYDQSDIEKIKDLDRFSNRLAKEDDPTGEVRVWKNVQQVVIKNAADANKEALEALNNGAEGIDFNFQSKEVDLNTLLNDILPEYCYLSFSNTSENTFIALIEKYKTISNKSISISAEDNIELDYTKYLIGNAGGIRILNVQTQNKSSFEEEIADLLKSCNTQIRLQLLKGVDIQNVVDSLIIHTSIGTDFFGEIAKVRSLRNLVYQLIRAYGMDEATPEDILISCTSSSWNSEAYNPHANMLKGSTAAMAAILGGCDVLIVEPEKEEVLYKRIARNVSSVLKEESYLSKVADPVAGSYYLENLTDELSRKSWSIFQNEFDK